MAGGQSNVLIIPRVRFDHAGLYSVRVTNAVSSVVSAEALLTVVPDTFGPKLLSAVVNELGASNRILVSFSERLSEATALDPAHYRVTRLATGASIPVSGPLYLPQPPQVLLQVGGPDWVPGDNYYLTVNGVRDWIASNSIAPDSRIGIGWPQVTRVLNADHFWSYHSAAAFDPGVFATAWWIPNYQAGPWWAEGAGPFCGGPIANAPCLGEFRTEIGFQYEPSLFRTTFQWLPQLGLAPRLRASFTADDGVVLYLNGVELFRNNLPAGPIQAATLAPVAVAGVTCATQTMTLAGLRPGTNWIAAAVCQSFSAGGDTVFGLVLDALHERTSPVPSDPPPELRVVAGGSSLVEISWAGGGFALESSPTLGDSNSAPAGPWTEVPGMTNPYTTPAAATQQFYRLKK